MSAAAEVREHLAAARSTGADFDAAWEDALAATYLRTSERADWEIVLAWSRPHFRHAYLREPAESVAIAVAALAEVAA